MKKETYANKLNELLGITEEVEAVKLKVEAKKGNIIGVTEDEINLYRAREAITYFLQAPELFHPRTCKQCETPFLVSRLHVSCCSYECINRWIEENYGVSWSRKNDLELMVKEVYEGNEPLWIRNLSTLQKALERLTSTLTPSETPVANEASTLSQETLSPPAVSGPSQPTIPISKIPPPRL